MNKFSYATNLSKANKTKDGFIDLPYKNSESDNVVFYGLVGNVPKYSKPFTDQYIQKIQSDYQNWINLCHEKDNPDNIKEGESKSKKGRAKLNSSSLTIQDKNVSVKPSRLLSKSLFIPNSNISENKGFSNYDKIMKMHRNKQFHAGCVERRDDGTIKTFDKNILNLKDIQQEKLSAKMLKYDKLDLKKKQKKSRLLHKEMTDFLNRKRDEKIQLGLACHQEWAIMKANAPFQTEDSSESMRPITASSQEAIDELNQFEEKQKILRREKKYAIRNQLNDDEAEDNSVKENSGDTNDVQSFKLTQVPPESALT